MKRRRIVKRKNNDSYLILILVCLLILNIGALSYRFFKNNKIFENFNNLAKIFTGYELSFGEDNFINDKEPIIPNTVEKDVATIDDEGELKTKGDYIINRLEEYESLIMIKDSHGISSIENIPKPLNINKVSLNKDEDYILVYHTHGTESFLTENPKEYHNADTEKNVVSVGDVLQKVLEANGHKVDHVRTLHDLPSYNSSYTRSLNTINSKKAENKNLKIFLDVHRDGVDSDADYKDRFLETARIDINGVSTATFSLVVGPDTPNYESVLSFAKYIKAVSDTVYPGFCNGIIIKPAGKYNLFASDYSALLEVGSNLITQEEAKECAKLLGEILSLVIDSIVE